MADEAAMVQGEVEREPEYRILLPLDRYRPRPGLIAFAGALAKVKGGEIHALHVTLPDDPDTRWSLSARDQETLGQVPHEMVTRSAERVGAGIVAYARESGCDLILLDWRGRPRAIRNQLGHILDPVVEDAPCKVALLKGDYTPPGDTAPRYFLATAGGPNAVGALTLLVPLLRESGGTLTLLRVVPEGSDDEEREVARQSLDRLLEKSGLDEEEIERHVQRRVVPATDTAAALVAAAKNHDLVFLGATNDTVFQQLRIGSLVEQVATSIGDSAVVVVRGSQAPARYWLRRAWRRLDQSLPDLEIAERLDTYKRVRRGARANVNFYFLMLCSVIIATMGLLINSGAVIIGAMLVAPLMLPILAMGLGVVMGDNRLLRIGTVSVVRGVLLAIAVACVLTLLARVIGFEREALLTAQVGERTQPTLFDLAVALAAGAAGAYSISRSGVSAALPGVAIAAALVPPLSVVGIGIALREPETWVFALLLFVTNLIAIIFSGAIIYIALGFFPQEEDFERQARQRRNLLVMLTAIFLIVVPLRARLVNLVSTTTDEITRSTLDSNIQSNLREALGGSDLALLDFSWERIPEEDRVELDAVLYATGPQMDARIACLIRDFVTPQFERPVDVRLTLLLSNEMAQVPDIETRCLSE